MLKVGLTGGIGSGKSTVSNMFKKSGIPLIDSDAIAREVLVLYPEINKNIEKVFGKIFFDNEGNLKRRELGRYVFGDENRKRKLENIILPYIIKEIFVRFEQYNKIGEKICVADMPTMFEVKLDKSTDVNILVWVDRETQRKRIAHRDNLSSGEIDNRISSQISLDEKRKLVDFVIDNSGSIEETEKQFKDILEALYRIEVENEIK